MSKIKTPSKTTVYRALVAVVGLILIIITLLGVYLLSPKDVDDMPGRVFGPNPQSIPESQLPYCNFTGSEMTETPCYSPPGAQYL